MIRLVLHRILLWLFGRWVEDDPPEPDYEDGEPQTAADPNPEDRMRSAG